MATDNNHGDSADKRKIFVGALHPDTREENLRAHFSNFGEVTQATVKLDLNGRSRGFGFVTFSDPMSVGKVLSEQHYINNKKVDPKAAQPQGASQGGASKVPTKIFIGGIDPNAGEEFIRNHFGQHTITKVEWPWDKNRQARKNYVFVEFDSMDAVEQVLRLGEKQHVGDRMCDVRKALPTQGNQNRQRGMMGDVNGMYADPYMWQQGYSAYGDYAFPYGMPGQYGMGGGQGDAGQMGNAYAQYPNYNGYSQYAQDNNAAAGQNAAAAAAAGQQYGYTGNFQGQYDQAAMGAYGQQQQWGGQWAGQQAGQDQGAQAQGNRQAAGRPGAN